MVYVRSSAGQDGRRRGARALRSKGPKSLAAAPRGHAKFVQLFKRDDFQLWVTDPEGNPAAVAPLAARGSGDARVHVLYATPGSPLAAQKRAAEQAGQPLILGAEHPMAMQAFRLMIKRLALLGRHQTFDHR